MRTRLFAALAVAMGLTYCVAGVMPAAATAAPTPSRSITVVKFGMAVDCAHSTPAGVQWAIAHGVCPASGQVQPDSIGYAYGQCGDSFVTIDQTPRMSRFANISEGADSSLGPLVAANYNVGNSSGPTGQISGGGPIAPDPNWRHHDNNKFMGAQGFVVVDLTGSVVTSFGVRCTFLNPSTGAMIT